MKTEGWRVGEESADHGVITPVKIFRNNACYFSRKRQCSAVYQMTCHFHGMVNLQVNSVQ